MQVNDGLEQLSSQVTAPVAKAVTVLTLGVTSWTLQDISYLMSGLAGGAGFFYSLHLLTEWWWKKVWRPLFTKRGWIKTTPRRHG